MQFEDFIFLSAAQRIGMEVAIIGFIQGRVYQAYGAMGRRK